MMLLPCSAGMSGPAETGKESHAHRARYDATYPGDQSTEKGRVNMQNEKKDEGAPERCPAG
jgi:hypothetical protein